MKVITANRLSDGIVVYLAAGDWKPGIGGASVLSAPDAVEAGLAVAARAVAGHEVVDVNAIEIELDEKNSPRPLRLRERIRAFGPTVPFGESALAA